MNGNCRGDDRYSGFYKGVQSAGAAVAWQLDTRRVSLLSQLIANWSFTAISFPLLLVLVVLVVKDGDKVDEEGSDPALKPSASPATGDDRHGTGGRIG
ncbi:hypothetical protein AAC387_Pa01g3469 [Persea americana]